MNALIIYDSKFGNTEQVARAIASALHSPRLIRADAARKVDLAGCELLVVGGPTQKHGMSPALKTLFTPMGPGSLDGMPAAAFDTRYDMTRLLSGSAAVGIEHQLKNAGACLVAPPMSFFVRASEGPLEDGELERAAAWGATLLSKVSSDPEPATTL
jgi:flavodoxin